MPNDPLLDRAGWQRLIVVAALACGIAGIDAGAPAFALEAGGLPFWGKPFPYGYAQRHPGCRAERRVETAAGPRIETVWICGRTLRARY